MAVPRDLSYADEVITLLLKPPSSHLQDQTFTIHKRHACRYSPILDKAFNLDQKTRFTIKDSTPLAVNLLREWLYMQEINLHIHHGQSACKNHDLEDHLKAKACKEEVGTLIELWLVAGRLQIFKLQNRAMGCMLKVARKCASTFGVFYMRVYAKTQPGSVLREFMVRLSAWNEDFHEFETRPHLFPPAMLRDLATTYRKALPEVVAAARRRDMQRNHHELMVKETAIDPDAMREMGLDEMLHKYPRRELSLEAVGWSMPAGSQQTDLKAWEELITRRSPSKATRASTPAAVSNLPEEDLLGLWGSPSKEDRKIKEELEEVEENIATPKASLFVGLSLDRMETKANTWEYDTPLPTPTPQAMDLNEPKTSHWEIDTPASVPDSPASASVKNEDNYLAGGLAASLKKTRESKDIDNDIDPATSQALFSQSTSANGVTLDFHRISKTYVDVPAPVGLLIDIDQPDGWTNIVTSKVHDVLEATRKSSGGTKEAADKSLGNGVVASEKVKVIDVKSAAPVTPALNSAKLAEEKILGNWLSASEKAKSDKENKIIVVKPAAPASPAIHSVRPVGNWQSSSELGKENKKKEVDDRSTVMITQAIQFRKSTEEKILGSWLSSSEKEKKKVMEVAQAKLTPQAMHFSQPVDEKWMGYWGPAGKNFQKQVDAALDLPTATTPALPAPTPAMNTPVFESEDDLLGLATIDQLSSRCERGCGDLCWQQFSREWATRFETEVMMCTGSSNDE
ncbi:uncharacterized protein PAC_01009 [Phialocephala subalpina]|uniref:BTB domain-containing protein n=1 Tax=Phialocephala subalpina TaxID=576137 RepID=A0A1L7WEF3_9HELO|nr:uncharacterized protein PAC_01009 [Phialocephala subalpina]